jgi:hypothetical protein
MTAIPLAFVLVVASTAGCRRHAPISPTPAPWLDGKVDEQGKSASQGGDVVGTPFHGTAFKKGQEEDFSVMLDATKCYWFSGVGDEQVEKLYLFLFDQEDHKVQVKKAEGPMALMTHCPEQSGMFKLRARVDEGVGHYSLGVYSKTAPAKVAPPPKPEAPKAQGPDLEAMIDKSAAASAPGAKRVGEFFASSADEQDWSTQLDAGTCYSFIAQGTPGKVKKLWLYLWDQSGKRIIESKGESPNATIGHCAKETGMFKFQVKVHSGSGDYKLGIYAKDAAKAPKK